VTLSDDQVERYSRQILLPEVGGRGQERLLAARVVLRGDAAVASFAADLLAAAGVGVARERGPAGTLVVEAAAGTVVARMSGRRAVTATLVGRPCVQCVPDATWSGVAPDDTPDTDAANEQTVGALVAAEVLRVILGLARPAACTTSTSPAASSPPGPSGDERVRPLRSSRVTADVNPVQLKIALATRGARLDRALRAALTAVPDFMPRAVDLTLPEDVRVLVPIDDAATPSGPYMVASENGQVIVVGDDALRVEVFAGGVPKFYGRRTTSGRPMWQVATVAGTHLLVSPAASCGFSTRGAPCPFCREGARPAGEQDRAATIADVVEVVRAAFEEGAAEFVLFNSSVFDAEDGGIAFLTPYIEAVRKHFDTFVAVQVHPPRNDVWIDRTYAMGVDAVSYNLELFDPEALNRHCIGRVRYIGRERYLDALGHAANIFPAGTVWTDLVLGLEPAESTMAGIEAVAAAGVVPCSASIVPARTPSRRSRRTKRPRSCRTSTGSRASGSSA
jgi:hypothetical protein